MPSSLHHILCQAGGRLIYFRKNLDTKCLRSIDFSRIVLKWDPTEWNKGRWVGRTSWPLSYALKPSQLLEHSTWKSRNKLLREILGSFWPYQSSSKYILFSDTIQGNIGHSIGGYANKCSQTKFDNTERSVHFFIQNNSRQIEWQIH